MKKKVSPKVLIATAVVSSVVITLGLIILAILLSYQQTKKEAITKLAKSSHQFEKKITLILDDVNDSLDHIQLRENYTLCNQRAIDALQKAVFNMPIVSAIAIANAKGTVICTNLGKPHKSLQLPNYPFNSSVSLTGPYNIAFSNSHALFYTIDHKDYSATALILPQMLNQYTAIELDSEQSVSLYNTQAQQALIQLGPAINFTEFAPTQVSEIDSNIVSLASEAEGNFLSYISKIISLNNTYITSSLPMTWVWKELLINNVILGGLGILLSAIVVYLIYYSTRRHLSLENEIKRAIDAQDFMAYYQPVFNLSNKQCQGVEVLIRWQGNNNQIIMPDNFIDTAEKTGLIMPMTLWLIEQAVSDCLDFLQDDPEFHIAINLSAIHFQSNKIHELALYLCDKHQISPKQIIFELTERSLVDVDSSNIIKLMHDIHESGFGLAIDDFGTGYSSLSYLKHFDFDYLKIDKLFVSAIGTGAITEGLNDSIIALAKNLHYKIIAEGIETEQQFQYLKSQGVEFAQGWLFAKALPIEELKEFISNSSANQSN